MMTSISLRVDLDDTLFDYSGRVEECWREAAMRVAAPAGVDPDVLVTAIRQTRRWFWGDPERHRQERADMMSARRKITAHAAAGGVDGRRQPRLGRGRP